MGTIGPKKQIIVSPAGAKKSIQIGQGPGQGIFQVVKTSQGMGLQQTMPRINIVQKQAVSGTQQSTATVMSTATVSDAGSLITSQAGNSQTQSRQIVKLIQPNALGGKQFIVKSPNIQVAVAGKVGTANSQTFLLTNKAGQTIRQTGGNHQQIIVVSTAPQMRTIQSLPTMATTPTTLNTTVVSSGVKPNINFAQGTPLRMIRSTAPGPTATNKPMAVRMPVGGTPQRMTIAGKTVMVQIGNAIGGAKKTVTLLPSSMPSGTMSGQSNIIQQGNKYIVVPRNVITLPQAQTQGGQQVRAQPVVQTVQAITQQPQQQQQMDDDELREANIEQMDGAVELRLEQLDGALDELSDSDTQTAQPRPPIRVGLFGGAPINGGNTQQATTDSSAGGGGPSTSSLDQQHKPEPMDEDDDIENQISTVKIEKYDLKTTTSTAMGTVKISEPQTADASADKRPVSVEN